MITRVLLMYITDVTSTFKPVKVTRIRVVTFRSSDTCLHALNEQQVGFGSPCVPLIMLAKYKIGLMGYGGGLQVGEVRGDAKVLYSVYKNGHWVCKAPHSELVAAMAYDKNRVIYCTDRRSNDGRTHYARSRVEKPSPPPQQRYLQQHIGYQFLCLNSCETTCTWHGTVLYGTV